jgi:hypothetical protein
MRVLCVSAVALIQILVDGCGAPPARLNAAGRDDRLQGGNGLARDPMNDA